MINRLIKLVGAEFTKLRHQKLLYIALSLIILTVILTVVATASGEGEISDEVISGGFRPLSQAGELALQLGAIFLLIFGSMTIASESSSGVLRMVLIKPFRRGEFILAKVITLIILALIITMFVGVLSFILIGQFYGFGNVTEPASPDYKPEPHVTKAVMLRYFIYTFTLTLLPLITVALFGLWVSTLIENPGVAIGLSVLLYLLLGYLIEGLAEGIAPYLFNHYNTFYLSTLRDLSQGILTEIWRFRAIDTALGLEVAESFSITPARQWIIAKSIIIPLGYSIFFFVSSVLIFRKKDILT